MKYDLSGDRYIEYAWVSRELPLSHSHEDVFDLGPSRQAITSQFAIARGYEVTAMSLEPLEYQHPLLHFSQGDFLQVDVMSCFDWVLNISTIEHFGIAGRYGVTEDYPDADLRGMERLHPLMCPGAKMILTIPVGHDAVIRPYHRVYGRERLPLLLGGYWVEKSEFWAKREMQFWDIVDEDTALDTQPQDWPTYYALGLYVLRLRHGSPA